MIAIDWGTSAFRAYRIDASGAVTERRAAPRGVLAIAGGAFAEALEAEIGDWLAAEREPIWMSGMIGSRQGWREVPYVPCPADAAAIAAGCVEIGWGEGRRAAIVPG
ncbi:MAG TPA: 2-dehydro-3-deoxygalactonokinase, partial [Stellaceae bacterium]|nr:2-dehydro-3-deoxygalactonokinase [Stellaceae bacterium]